MSIEQTLERIAAALETLAGQRMTPPTEAKPVKAAKAAKIMVPEPEVEETEEEETEEETAEPATLAQILTAIKALIVADKRDAAVAVLEKFKVKAAKELKPTQYEAALAALRAI